MFALCVSFIFAIYRLFCVFIDFYYIVFLFILFDHQHGEHLYIYILLYICVSDHFRFVCLNILGTPPNVMRKNNTIYIYI